MAKKNEKSLAELLNLCALEYAAAHEVSYDEAVVYMRTAARIAYTAAYETAYSMVRGWELPKGYNPLKNNPKKVPLPF